MDKKARTIQLFLPNGDPKSAKRALVTSEIGVLHFCSLKNLEYLNSIVEKNHSGVYFLFGNDLDKETVYIGMADDIHKRLKEHINKGEKEFKSIVFYTSQSNSFNIALMTYLESYCIRKAKDINRFLVQNKNNSSEVNLVDSDLSDVETFFENLHLLISTIGFPLFDSVISTNIEENKKTIYEINYMNVKSSGEYTDEGFVIYKGSKIPAGFRSSADNWVMNIRDQLVKSGDLQQINGGFEFSKNVLFNSPSRAAMAVYGGRANGWTSWKTSDGKTLDEVERKKNE